MSKIDSFYISSYIPIQDLDEIRPIARDGIAPLSADDLFLVSQISAYANNDSNAIAVSKKLTFDNLRKKLSDDFSIYPIKLSVHGLCGMLRELSIDTNNDIDGLCAAIRLSASTLSTYTNTRINDLSNTVSSNYVTKYHEFHDLIVDSTDPNELALFASKIELSDGRMTILEQRSLDSMISLDKWKISNWAINVDTIASQLSSIDNTTTKQIVYTVPRDSYVNCLISAVEADDVCSPMQVILRTTRGGRTLSAVIDEFNNPGGFSGTTYWNYYHFGVAIKSLDADTSVLLKYADNSAFKEGTEVLFKSYQFFGVVTKTDLANYVQKLDTPPGEKPLDYYKIQISEDGLIRSAEPFYYGPASSSNLGLVKINGSISQPSYPLKLNASNYAYVTVPHATSSTYGTIMLNYTASGGHNYTDSGEFMACGLENNESNHAVTYIHRAENDRYGVIKLSNNDPAEPDANGAIYAYLSRDTSGHGRVKMWQASRDHYGMIKTGTPDTTGVQVARSIYIDENDGIAKVNVVVPMGVGQFYNSASDKGYTTGYAFSIDKDTSSVAIGSTKVRGYANANDINGSNYGTRISYVPKNVAGQFYATVIYEGTQHAFDGNPVVQVICANTLATTINLNAVQMSSGKHFHHSQYLGVFDGGNASKMFGIITNTSNIFSGTDHKVTFLLKLLNEDMP